MRASVTYITNPLQPASGRELKQLRRRRRLSAVAPQTDRPFICLVNGKPVLRCAWNRKLRDGDIVMFVCLVQGDGGGGGSNPIATVAMIAVMVYAPELAGAMNTALGLSLGTVGMTALTIGVEIAGAMLVNALFGPPIPPKQSLVPPPSPTYSLQARGNVARLQDPIPCQYGRMMVYPPYAADPYTEYAGNNQYLYQLFCLGQGEFSIEAIRLLTTSITLYADVTYEVVPPGGAVTLFPSNVVTSSNVTGQELLTSNVPGSPPNVTVGPFVANAPATQTNAIAIDIVLPRGLYYANDQGGLSALSVSWLVQAQLIDDNSNALGAWFTLGAESLTLATNTPQRLSYRYSVTLGRYQVQCTRTNAKDLSSRSANDLLWAAMRAYLPGSQSYGDVTLIAMRMLATNQLSSATNGKINVICTRVLPTWNPNTGWSTLPARAAPDWSTTNGWASTYGTRSIAWALADCCRASYSAALPDARVDLNQLYVLDQTWSARGDYFDAVYDTRTTFWQALTQIARAGRAKPYPQAGIYHFVRDQLQSLPVALFTPRSIVQGSFKAVYLMPTEQTPDAVIVQYVDSLTWLPATVLCQLPNSTAIRPAMLQLFGVTDRNHAWREGMYEAACNRWRRKLPQWQTEMEGFIPSFGDLVAVSHDMPQWGQSGEVLAVSGIALSNGVVTGTPPIVIAVSEPLTFTAGQQHYICFRRTNGSMSGPWTCSPGLDANQVILTQTPDMIPYTGSSQELTHFAFGPGQSYAENVLIRSVRPRNDHIVEIMAVGDNPLVHSADGSGTVPAGPATWLLPALTTQAPISGLNVVQGGSPSAPTLSISWQPSPGADHYIVQTSADGIAWATAANPSTNSCVISVTPGPIYVQVAAVGLTVSSWVPWNGNAGASIAPPSNVLGLALVEPFTGPICKISWSDAARASSYTVQVWAGTTLALVRSRTITATHFEYSAADAAADGGPWRSFTFKVIANGSGGTTSDAWSTLAVSNPQVAILNSVSVTGVLAAVIASYATPSDTDFSGIMIWASATTGFTPGAANLVYDGASNPVNININPNSSLFVRLAAYDVWGKDSLNVTGEFPVSTQQITATQITPGSISTPQLAANAITAASGILAAASVGSASIADLAVQTIHIANGAVTLSAFASSNGYTRYFTAGSLSAGSADDVFSSLTFSTLPGDDITVEAYFWLGNGGSGNAPSAVTLQPHLVLDAADTATGSAVPWATYNTTQHLGMILRSRISGDGNSHTLTLKVLATWGAFTNSAQSQYTISNCILSVFTRRK